MTIKGYFTLPKSPELEPHHLMYFSIILRTHFSGCAVSIFCILPKPVIDFVLPLNTNVYFWSCVCNENSVRKVSGSFFISKYKIYSVILYPPPYIYISIYIYMPHTYTPTCISSTCIPHIPHTHKDNLKKPHSSQKTNPFCLSTSVLFFLKYHLISMMMEIRWK